MDSRPSDLHFRLMAFAYKFRDLLLPRRPILEEAGIRPGMQVLDFGCGPGSYLALASEMVGESGMVYALDAHPRALASVRAIRANIGPSNVQTILSDCETGLPGDAIDVVLLHDVLHDLHEPRRVLRELHRVLKPGGLLSFSDHHLKRDEIVSRVTADGWFRLLRRGQRTYAFAADKPSTAVAAR